MSDSHVTPIASARSRPGVVASLRESGYACVAAKDLRRVLAVDVGALDLWRDSWNLLPRDQYLRDGGQYRSRRHSCFIQDVAGTSADPSADPSAAAAPISLRAVPHRAHWQPTSYNALHGGMERWFEPISPEVAAQATWRQLLTSIGSLFAEVRPAGCWYIEAHQ